ncbi:peptidase family M28 family [Histoplasma capsulatum]|uniref:Peptide hydrolase n=1 Tax=Ajellomyces capsulatus TaxID=5037 RepID=A0A8A1MKT0_AJECA|nr:peptidase family M28 family [Histoplasma capsulatum]
MASSRAQWFNPIAFTPWPVTCITTIVYLALLIPILVINLVVPSAPETNPKGVNLTEAWRDLQHLTGGFHPYNSRRNDEVHEWLLSRINSIIRPTVEAGQPSSANDNLPEVFVFDDNRSNLTYSNGGVGKTSIVGVYFESTNIIVYIRGSEDGLENWWEHSNGKPKGKGGVLVNAHYDSVSTGYGATDDGIGVVSLLQLLRYFTTPGNNPRKGLVLLFNNGEEDYLNGAHVFSQHPLSNFTHTFLNLEGAGAGGRAALFRTTDTEVTRFYGNTKHSFGSVLAADGFKLGLLRSQTDYPPEADTTQAKMTHDTQILIPCGTCFLLP